jgi:hypothetical protein
VRIIEEGHIYALTNYESGPDGLLKSVDEYGNWASTEQVIKFISKIAGKDIHPGTTNEEVLAMLIDRMWWLDKKMPCVENKKVIICLQTALDYLDLRTRRREEQGVEGKDEPHKS